ncbi:hypothetical protein C0991_000688 [Blastosporella zonata]|nr:hypothetical protein C0991_000688 [Blastosporella zonata]
MVDPSYFRLHWLRSRIDTLAMAFTSLEFWSMSIHDMDRPWLLESLHHIFEDVGCLSAIYNTTLAVSLTPPVIIGCVSAVYSILAIRAFAKSRAQFKEFLSSNNNLNSSRYIRLMMLAGIETALTVPFGVFGIVENCLSVAGLG